MAHDELSIAGPQFNLKDLNQNNALEDANKNNNGLVNESSNDKTTPEPNQGKEQKAESFNTKQESSPPTTKRRKGHSKGYRNPRRRGHRLGHLSTHSHRAKRIGRKFGLKFTSEQLVETMRAINPNYPSIYTQVIMEVLEEYQQSNPNDFLTARQIMEQTYAAFQKKSIDKPINLISIYWSLKNLLNDNKIERTILKIPINNKIMWVMAFKAKSKEVS